MTTPEFLPVLSAGSHAGPAAGACVMEYISLLAGEKWTNTPSCTHPVLAGAAQALGILKRREALGKVLLAV